MSDGPWIRFYPSDWLAGTRGLSAAETGVYITLIAMMYERGAPLVNDVQRLSRLCGTTAASLRSTLEVLIEAGKIELVDGGLWNSRVGVETEIRREKSNSAKESASRRWLKAKEYQGKSDADAIQSHSVRSAGAYANQISDVRKEGTRAPRAGSSPVGFDQFWEAYPNKVGKPAALKAFGKAIGRAPRPEIMAGLARYLAKTDDRPWCNPATWLNQDRWADQPAAPGQAPVRIVEDDSRWATRLSAARERRMWSTAQWGPAPGSEGCRVPVHLLEASDGLGWAEWNERAA